MTQVDREIGNPVTVHVARKIVDPTIGIGMQLPRGVGKRCVANEIEHVVGAPGHRIQTAKVNLVTFAMIEIEDLVGPTQILENEGVRAGAAVFPGDGEAHEAGTHQVIWSVDAISDAGDAIEPRREQDLAFTGNIVQAMVWCASSDAPLSGPSKRWPAAGTGASFAIEPPAVLPAASRVQPMPSIRATGISTDSGL